MVGVGRDQFALLTARTSALTDGVDLRLAANAGELIVRGDEDARQVVRALRLEPLSIVPTSLRPTNAAAARAVRYGDATVFFVDDRSYAEPEAFWVAGAATSSVLIQAEARVGTLELELRNAPIENRLTLEAGEWREEMTLSAGEERRVRVPLDVSRDSTLLRLSTSAGFRPSAVDPNSRDDRYLGVWVRVAP
jgi:hypothetical protein